MFGIFKKRAKKELSTDELKAQMDKAVQALPGKWIEFHRQLKFKTDVQLSEIIEIFLTPAREYIVTQYPAFASAPNEVIWMIVFTAVMEAGTHTKEDVNEAVAILEAKYT